MTLDANIPKGPEKSNVLETLIPGIGQMLRAQQILRCTEMYQLISQGRVLPDTDPEEALTILKTHVAEMRGP